MKYFIGNWKMFGIPGSVKILDRINNYVKKDKPRSKNYKYININIRQKNITIKRALYHNRAARIVPSGQGKKR